METESRLLRVWDIPTRVFHWCLAALVAVAWGTGEMEEVAFTLHAVAGYGVLALIGFRLIWGVIGPRHARFSDFIKPASALRVYAAGLLRGRHRRVIGHNPIGGWMVVGLLAITALVSFTGLFAEDDGVGGPFARHVSAGVSDALGEIHEALWSVLAFLVVVHVAGVIVHGLLTGENLIRSMLTGMKARRDGDEAGLSRFEGLVSGVIVFTASVLAVWWLVR